MNTFIKSWANTYPGRYTGERVESLRVATINNYYVVINRRNGDNTKLQVLIDDLDESRDTPSVCKDLALDELDEFVRTYTGSDEWQPIENTSPSSLLEENTTLDTPRTPPTPQPTHENGRQTRAVGEVRVYPNLQGKVPGDENRGVLRVGVVESNTTTLRLGVADLVAAVTREAQGEVRFYVWVKTQNRQGIWKGPYEGLSEEVQSNDEGSNENAII